MDEKLNPYDEKAIAIIKYDPWDGSVRFPKEELIAAVTNQGKVVIYDNRLEYKGNIYEVERVALQKAGVNMKGRYALHANGNTRDNRLENLVPLTRNERYRYLRMLRSNHWNERVRETA